ncbi:MAG TPA: type II secretion system protein GspG [Patescibacteria group bacterium]
MKNNKQMNKGFSLIELIVVMTIVIVMTALGMVSYSSTTQKSRDGRRQSDLAKIQIALEMYRQQKNAYPATGTWSSDLTSGGYLNQVPTDPKGGNYVYVQGASTFTYQLCGCMEQTNNVGNNNGNCSGNLTLAACAAANGYQVVNP